MKHQNYNTILTECPALGQDTAPPLEFVRYKGRGYCRAKINENGILQLTNQAAGYLGLEIGSNIILRETTAETSVPLSST